MIDIPIHAEVECTDGHCGQTTHVIIDPTVRRVTHFVVQEWKPPMTERLVSINEVAEATPDRIHLRCTTDDLAAMEPFIVTQYIQVTRPDYENYPYLVWPYAVPETTKWVPMEHERIPAGELAVRRGALVEATDGHVGQVGELLVDEASREITHLVLRDGHPWDQKEVTIPISHIDRVQDDTVYLKLDKQAIGSLPAIPVRRREGLEEMVMTLRAKREATQAELREKLETQLQVWHTQLEELTARWADARAEAKADLLRQINLLREKRQATRARLERSIEADIAELDAMSAAAAEMITTGMYKMAAEERAEHERRAEELRARRERARVRLERNIEDDIAELDAAIEMIAVGMGNMAAEEQAERERRAEELRTRRERAQAKMRDLCKSSATARKGP